MQATRILGRGAARPSGRTAAIFPGPVLYTDSLLVLDARSGRLLWHDQVTPHDVRDYDFHATPIVWRRSTARNACSARARPDA